MNEEQFQQKLRELQATYPEQTEVDGDKEAWAKLQYDNAFGIMNGMWNPAMAEQFLANLETNLQKTDT